MMKINGFNGTNTQIGAMGMAQANDSVSKNIQNQIANAQQKLQDLSSNEELSLEDSFALYHKGMDLLKKCSSTIDQVEKKMLVLDGEGETHEFEM